VKAAYARWWRESGWEGAKKQNLGLFQYYYWTGVVLETKYSCPAFISILICIRKINTYFKESKKSFVATVDGSVADPDPHRIER
jgi:hypothetical protein